MEVVLFTALLASVLLESTQSFDIPFRILQDKAEVYPLPNLPYEYNELEPWIDEGTVRAHHLGHHEAYRNKMNALLNQWRDQVCIDMLQGMCEVSDYT